MPPTSASREARFFWYAAGWVVGFPLAFPIAAIEPAAEVPTTGSITEFADFGLEQLANMSVTPVGKTEQKLAAAPAAIYVRIEEDVRRSGATSIPKSMSRVPGPGATFTLKPSVEPTTEREVP